MLAGSELAGCSVTPEQSLQMKMEPEPAGLTLLVSSLTSSQHEAFTDTQRLPGRLLPNLRSNQLQFCCSCSEEAFNDFKGGLQDWGW